jgi:transcriptional regulator with XRE-family HTH domain
MASADSSIPRVPPGASASRIRTYRQRRGMSVRKLAETAGLSPSLVSQIERGKSEPSISSLRKLAEALSVSIFYLLDEREESGAAEGGRSIATRVVRRAERRRVTLPHSGLRYELLCPDVSGRMEAWLGTLEPGAATGDTARGHLSDEFMWIISGSTELEYGDEKLVLEANDSIYLDGTVSHRMRALGEKPLVFLSVLSPPVL